MTEAKFQDFQLHVEVMVPEGSNSGIYLRGRYEVQVQDDHGKEPHARGMGGIYGQVTPVENAALPAGEWQSFDITLVGRTVTVVLNGKTIIDGQEIPGITGGALDSREAEPGPIFLQGDHGRILYRNLVLTPGLDSSGSAPPSLRLHGLPSRSPSTRVCSLFADSLMRCAQEAARCPMRASSTGGFRERTESKKCARWT